MKKLLILASLCSALAGETPTNLLSVTNAHEGIFELPYILDTATSEPPKNYYDMIWKCNGDELAHMTLSTNTVTQWIPIEQAQVRGHDLVKQVGILITNRVLVVIHDGTTNEMVLKMLGREEWPIQHRTVATPQRQPVKGN